MSHYHVTRVNKPHHFSQHEHITHLGASNWRMSIEEVIKKIDAGTDDFYIDDPKTGMPIPLIVVRPSGSKPPYVQAAIKNKVNDILLSMPEGRISPTACLLGVCRCC